MGILGDGIDLNGLAIDSTGKYTIRYTDGVSGKDVFADQVCYAVADAATPAFAGWTPEVAETVTCHAIYAATWTANGYTVTVDPMGGLTLEYGVLSYVNTVPKVSDNEKVINVAKAYAN